MTHCHCCTTCSYWSCLVVGSMPLLLLQELEDAERIRQSVIDCFETASLPHLTDDERRHTLSFLIVGGGPTGVEFAAELHDLVHEDLSTLYPSLQPFISVTIIQSGDHILNTLSTSSSTYLRNKFCISPIPFLASVSQSVQEAMQL